MSNPLTIIYEIVESIDGNYYGKELLTGLLFPIREKAIVEYFYNYDNDHSIEKRFTYKDDNIDRFKYILHEDDVASINKVEEYLNKRDETKYIANIKALHNENVFNKEIILKENEPLETQNELTILMHTRHTFM